VSERTVVAVEPASNVTSRGADFRVGQLATVVADNVMVFVAVCPLSKVPINIILYLQGFVVGATCTVPLFELTVIPEGSGSPDCSIPV
jgi:hypothetical protein